MSNKHEINIIVANRNFPTLDEAVKYCDECDFSYDMILILESINNSN
jgi:hypothetical protein